VDSERPRNFLESILSSACHKSHVNRKRSAEPQYSINYTLLREHLLKKYNEDRLQNAFNAAVVVYDTEARERFERAAVEAGFVMPE